MKQLKHYRVTLTEEEDALLKQKAEELGISAADIIRLGIKQYIGSLESSRKRELRNNSEFIRNWEEHFGQSVVQEFGERWQSALQTAYLLVLARYKGSVYFKDGNFKLVSRVIEVEDSSNAALVVEEMQLETLPEQEVKENFCHSLKKLLGGEWKGDEWIIQTFLTGLRADLTE